MEEFFNFPRFLKVFFPIRLNVGDSAKINRSQKLILTLLTSSLMTYSIFVYFVTSGGIKDFDNFFGNFMVFFVVTFVALKYVILVIKRESVQRVLKSFKTSDKFDPTLKPYFIRFQKLQRIFLRYTFMSILASFISSVVNVINGHQIYGAFLKLSFEVSNPVILYSLMFWTYFTQSLALLLIYCITIITCKLIFITAMDFKQLGIDFVNLKVQESKSDPVPMRSVPMYQNLLTKFPPKVTKLFNLIQKLFFN